MRSAQAGSSAVSKLGDSPLPPSGERKFAVALFADLSGYTALCQRLDPEEVELTITPQMTALRTAVESSGGTIVSVAGDGFFALYGVPIAQSDAPTRAVIASRAMLELVSTRNAQPGLAPIPDVHIGVASGEVLVTPSQDSPGWSVIGSTVNLASRLCDAARAGEALFDHSSRGLIGDRVLWRSQRHLQVKGHDSTVIAWELDATVPEPLDDAMAGAFVGRLDAWMELDRAPVSAMRASKSQIVGIGGDAGIGKTRLLREWVVHSGLPHVWVSASPVTGIPLGELVRVLSATVPSDESTTLAQLESDSTTAYREDPFPLLAATARRLAADLASPTPAVIVLDDLRASDLSVVTLLEHLKLDPIEAPIVILCAFRDDADAPIATDVHLGPLDPDSISSLFADAFGAAPDEETAARLMQRVQGHPLLTLQTAAYLRESGFVEVDDDGAVRVRNAQAIEELPTSARLFIAARIDQLPASEKDTLLRLSCFGAEWASEWALDILGVGSASAISRLKSRALLETALSGNWRFSHGLVQQVAYAALTRRDRGVLHQRLYTTLGDTDAALRTYHAVGWFESMPTTDAAASRAAAEAALSSSLTLGELLFKTDAQSAHSTVSRVSSLLADHADAFPEIAAQLWTLDSQCLIELNRFDDALLASSHATELGDRAVLRGELRVRCMLAAGHAQSRLRLFESARQTLDDAAALAESIGDGSGKAHALRLMADTWRHSLFGRYISLTEEAYREFERCGDARGAAECARILAYLFTPSAPELYTRWARIARAKTPADDVRANAWIARNEAMASGYRYLHAAADAAAGDAIELAERCGAKEILHQAMGHRLVSLNMLGRPEEACVVAERILEIARRERNPRFQTVASAWAAAAFARAGKLARAIEELDSARARLPEFGPAEASDVASVAGTINRDRGHWADALGAFVEGTEIAASSDYVLWVLIARLEEARVRLLAGVELAADEMVELGSQCESIGAPVLASFFQALADAADVMAGRPVSLGTADPNAAIEEHATRADTAALRLELLGEDPTAEWIRARELWQQFGCTVWLARAQARCGDHEAANATLELLDSPAEARAWALGG